MAHFPRVDDHPFRRELSIEVLEDEGRIFGITKRGNDVALPLWSKVFAEAQVAHAVQELFVIGAVTLRPCGHSTFLTQLSQRLTESEQRMRRRRETELTVAFESLPLRQQVETDAPRIAGGLFECVAARDDEGKARHTFQAFVRGRNEVIRL